MVRSSTGVRPFRLLGVVFAALILALGASSAHAQDGLREFTEKVKRAVADADYSTLKQMVQNSRDMARLAGVVLEGDIAIAAIAEDPVERERLQNAYANLAQQYRLAYDDEVMVTREKWIKGLDKAQLEIKKQALDAYNAAYEVMKEAHAAADDATLLREAIEGFEKSYAPSVEIQDHYYAFSAANSIGGSYERINDWFAAVYWYQRAYVHKQKAGVPSSNNDVEARLAFADEYDKVKRRDLIKNDLPLEEARAQHQKDYEASLVVTLPEGSAAGGENAEGTLVPPKSPDAYEWIDDTEFKDEKVDQRKLHLPWYPPGLHSGSAATEPFSLGYTIEKEAKDKSFPFLPEGTATYDGKFFVDPDGPQGPQKAKRVNPKLGKPIAEKFKVKYEDGTEGLQSFELTQFPNTFDVFDCPFKYSGTDMLLLVRSLTAVAGKIRGEPVTIIDTNTQRGFNEAGEDTIIIGSGRDARIEPFSRLTWFEQEDGSFYPYEIKIAQKNGKLVRSRPYQGPLAPLRVEYTSTTDAKPAYLIAQGDGENSDVFIDLMKATDRMLWVPPTTLSIHKGYFVVGSGRNESSILIGRGLSKGFKVEPGRMNVWKLGAGEKGFWFDAKATTAGDVVTVDGASLRVYGGAGEEYFNFTNARLAPTVTLRREEGNGSKVGEEEMGSPSGMNPNATRAFFPGDVVFEKVRDTGVAMMLEEDHPVLGLIKSGWIGVN